MKKRSNLIVSLGLLVFVAGAAATFLVVRNNDDGSSKVAGPATQVLYAAKTIPSGTSGTAALDQGLVKTRSVSVSSKPPSALTDPSQLAGRTASASVPEGSIITSEQFAVPQTRLGTVKIPTGKTALALQLDFVPGLAGFVGSGDRIDIYGLLREGPGSPSAKLIMQNTEVLSVSPSGVTAQAVGSEVKPIFLLAVTTQEAERLAYLTTFQKLYFSLVPKDAPPSGPTTGTATVDALKQLS
jgi:Flp pilus assembly protein CpaB